MKHFDAIDNSSSNMQLECPFMQIHMLFFFIINALFEYVYQYKSKLTLD